MGNEPLSICSCGHASDKHSYYRGPCLAVVPGDAWSCRCQKYDGPDPAMEPLSDCLAPYYEADGVTIYHGDCREIIPTLPPVDLVVMSPPYNKGAQSGAYANMRDGYTDHDDGMTDPAYVEWQQDVLALLWGRLSDHGAIFYNHKPAIRDGIAYLPTRLIPPDVLLRQIIVWNRKGGMNWNPRFFCPQHEWVLLLARRDFALRSRGASQPGDVWTLSIEQTDHGHPCPFPLALPLTAIQATDAQLILDPFMGSGTTLRAAADLGRRAIGIELSERYCEVAVKTARGAFAVRNGHRECLRKVSNRCPSDLVCWICSAAPGALPLAITGPGSTCTGSTSSTQPRYPFEFHQADAMTFDLSTGST